MGYQVSVPIRAPIDRMSPILIDVERWPDWTLTITSVQRLDQGPFQRGSQARVEQPKLPAVVWTVSEVQPLRQFT